MAQKRARKKRWAQSGQRGASLVCPLYSFMGRGQEVWPIWVVAPVPEFSLGLYRVQRLHANVVYISRASTLQSNAAFIYLGIFGAPRVWVSQMRRESAAGI